MNTKAKLLIRSICWVISLETLPVLILIYANGHSAPASYMADHFGLPLFMLVVLMNYPGICAARALGIWTIMYGASPGTSHIAPLSLVVMFVVGAAFWIAVLWIFLRLRRSHAAPTCATGPPGTP